jgi:hypothetical protein
VLLHVRASRQEQRHMQRRGGERWRVVVEIKSLLGVPKGVC